MSLHTIHINLFKASLGIHEELHVPTTLFTLQMTATKGTVQVYRVTTIHAYDKLFTYFSN